MRKELFGVFGDRQDFERLRPGAAFSRIFEHEQATVGIRDRDLDVKGCSSAHATQDAWCVIYGEAYPPDGTDEPPAAWLLNAYAETGLEALSRLNGSYLACLATGDRVHVAVDPIRSRECFYTDARDVRVFGTDAAAVAATIPSPAVRTDGLLEYLHLGVTLGEKTSLTRLHRLPMDSVLTPGSVETLERFVYDPHRFEYVAELADRLARALERRSQIPGRKGLLLSAGYDSRTFLAGMSDIERSYTVGWPETQEVRGAIALADQYDTPHTAFEPDRRYLCGDHRKVRYSQGIKESLHIHHAGYTREIDVDTMYHGLLCDTFFRGHFTAEESIGVGPFELPRDRPADDPDPTETLLARFGYSRGPSEALAANSKLSADPERFVRKAIADEYQHAERRADSPQNALNACGIGNQPSMPFHTHIVDNFRGSFLATDVELINWHLSAPPEERTTGTFLRACERTYPGLCQQRPPDRPHRSIVLNEIERFVRRKTPLLTPFEPPWPNRNEMFAQFELDAELLPGLVHLHEPLPARHKLRIYDILGWMEQCAPSAARATRRLLAPGG